MRRRMTALLSLGVLVLSACAAPLRVEEVSFKDPQACPNSVSLDGLVIAAVPVDRLEDSKRVFSTDTKEANILPIQLIVRNSSQKEFEIDNAQIFGMTADGSYTVAYNLGATASRFRESSIGRTAATGAAVGALAGAAIGAGIGAAAGGAAGNAGKGAAVGAAVGGTTGAAAGTASGLSDGITIEFKKQLASVAFEDKVIYPGDLKQGFIYLRWQNYTQLRLKVFNISDNKVSEVQMPIGVCR